MLGQNTVRERSKTDASSPSTSHSNSSLYDAFTPPVPPLPMGSRPIPSTSPIADVFSSSALRPSSPSISKPLPPIMTTGTREIEDERSMVFVDMMPSDNTTVKGKRRSLSVSRIDTSSVMAGAILGGPPRTPDRSPLRTPVTENDGLSGGRIEDTTLNGIITHFKGGQDSDSKHASMMPTVTLQPPFRTEETAQELDVRSVPPSPSAHRVSTVLSNLDPATNPRNLSLQTSLRSSLGSAGGGTTSARNMHRQSLSPLRSRSGPAESLTYSNLPSPHLTGASSARGLRVIHRSTASSSEPSLIPTVVAADGARIVSQQDLMVNDLDLTRHSSSGHSSGRRGSTSAVSGSGNYATSGGDESPDMEVRGQELASRCWNEDEEFLGKEKIAEWLGGIGRINKSALQHYISNFDFSGLRLDVAFRRLCAKLYLKAETQQVDRILEEFSRRYWECNPNTLYGSSNLVHAVAYSLLLLNTDLHVADLTSRMSRSQFVRNTLAAIQMQLQPSSSTSPKASSPDVYDESGSLRNFPLPGSDQSSNSSSVAVSEGSELDTITRSKRSDSITSWNSISRDTILSSPALSLATSQATTPIVENDCTPNISDLQSSTTSMASSNIVYGRAWEAGMENLLKVLWFHAINRIITDFPSPSFATSTHEAIYGSSSSFLSPTLGFASNLSHTIIRETQEDDDRSVHSDNSTGTSISITDEELALLGAPWAKEGMLCRKQYWESANKRSKDKAWLDVFVVIQKGELNMFTFGENGGGGSGVFGGGNWLATIDNDPIAWSSPSPMAEYTSSRPVPRN
ncbi:sec7-like domain belongs to guanine nucleotide exchange factors [Lentinula edodes]|uniref:Sec7-like domain belongs to guanine nucleotide exchange factors n=1 Tax=Lentinula edodes TaxID=5353 RepID=A0A1Q3DZZ2_LENED|nr:sec7-like domain belongs to guanine nucleotide exchange factors [Lentinula edodes]